ncbi:MAG: bifunctional proline dehydrogenase/L-glutamate gamma-semialdehyde dehydrogenase [Bacteriovoracaceae bacterium]|nr:bifunctional proline dehydrogenase/L-glutamate gamma-semialdehyde dehydrogenase [Bacteriovoracaceae bacterium]
MSGFSLAEIYKITHLNLPQGWMLAAPEDYINLMMVNGAPTAEMNEILTQIMNFKGVKPFRREIQIKAFPILLGVNPLTKKIHAGSRRLARELALLDSLEIENNISQELKEHSEAISVLDSREFPTEWEWVSQTENLADWSDKQKWKEVEELTSEKLRHLVKHVQSYQPTLFERVSDWGLGLTATFSLIRIHLLKFLALLPSLDHDKEGFEVKRNLIESLRRLLEDDQKLRQKGVKIGGARALPRVYISSLTIGLQVVRFLPAKLLANIVRSLVKKMARRFIAGESIASSDKTLKTLHDSRREATLDQLGELVVSEEEADEYLKRVLSIVHGLKIHVQPGERNRAGINKAHVSIKVSALASDFKPQAFDYTYKLVAPRLKKILVEAKREQVFINVDAEHYHYRDVVLKIFRKVLIDTPELEGWGDCGIVIQAYLRDGASHLRDVVKLAKERKVRMPIRLVKGAYWDAETIEAQVHSHHAPQFLNKEESDLHFRQLAYLAFENEEHIQLAVGSHNLQDHCFIEALRQIYFPNAPVIEHQCLHMTYEALSHGLAKMGWPTRNYMPIGNLLVGMAYLVRRIMENSSQVGILTIMRSHNKKDAFQNPITTHEQKISQGVIQRDDLEAKLDSGFKNCTPLRLFIDQERDLFVRELEALKERLQNQQESFSKTEGLKVISSSHPEMIVGVINEKTADEAKVVIDEIHHQLGAGNGWSEKPRSFRLGVMLKAADKMWMERQKLSALIVYEAGKSWSEALGDVDEAIDFINFYVREELRLARKLEASHPRGVIGVIAPWNFPLAIPCGMAVAPLIAGNAVILKPAEQTPLIAQELAHLLYECGVPKSALAFLPGDGEQVGAPLVTSPLVSGIVFTGSKNVGQWIYRNAANQLVKHPLLNSWQTKKVITEMGGKNAIIVTNNCEQDETVSGILYSAFGHAGQKCSACSRVLVDEEVKDSLLKRLVKAIGDLEVGPATTASVLINPLISSADQLRVRQAVLAAKDEAEKFGGKVWIDRSQEEQGNYCVGPVLIELPKERATHPDSWAQREIFGPVVHIVAYNNLDEAIELFNSTEYGLTGGIYGQSQDDIDYLIQSVKCGNLYVNRPNTGARVAIEPFGGFKLSGTGPKAGGRDYLMNFHVQVSSQKAHSVQAWGKGSGYRFESPKPSGLSLASRQMRLSKLSQLILERFESLTGGVGEVQKRYLKQFIDWASSDLTSFIQLTHPNHTIPGQLSYDQNDLSRESVLFLMNEEKPHLAALLHLFSALAVGSGVAICCANQENYSNWKLICDLAWQSGFAKNNLDVYLTGKEEVQVILNDSSLSAVYISGAEDFVREALQISLPQESLKTNMRAIYTDYEHPQFGHWSDWLNQYLYTRSFAVNTMRHGAPLELGV